MFPSVAIVLPFIIIKQYISEMRRAAFLHASDLSVQWMTLHGTRWGARRVYLLGRNWNCPAEPSLPLGQQLRAKILCVVQWFL
jgi:hypothetical protein